MRHRHRRLTGIAFWGVALVAIGCGGSSPAAERVPVFTPTGSLGVARADFTATRLSDGRVLIAGGASASAAVEEYDLAPGTFAVAGDTSVGHLNATATGLTDGGVLVTGGLKDWSGGAGYVASSEIYR